MDKLKMTSSNEDPTAERRKLDHIELAVKSQIPTDEIDGRFYYEPLLSGHPKQNSITPVKLLKSRFDFPMWVSSMTGGTKYAKTINTNLARVCEKYNLGMGLGSCRSLLYDNEKLKDFDVRKIIGERPLYANLGIAQLEEIVASKKYDVLTDLINKLSADGLIVHINPFQEWLQPEGDRYYNAPIETIKRLLDHLYFPIIVKEVGQGMGKGSLKALMELPLQAIDFAANGGTNFSKLELLRGEDPFVDGQAPLVNVGHSAMDMVDMTNHLLKEMGNKVQCQEFIVSGGIKTFLDGYYCIQKLNAPAIYGQASGFLKYAKESFEMLDRYVEQQVNGLKVAYSFLQVK